MDISGNIRLTNPEMEPRDEIDNQLCATHNQHRNIWRRKNLEHLRNFNHTAKPGSRETCAGQLQNIDQAIPNCVSDKSRGIVDSQSLHHVGAMNRHRIHADIELPGDLFV